MVQTGIEQFKPLTNGYSIKQTVIKRLWNCQKQMA